MFTALPDPARVARIGQVTLGPAPVKTLASLMPTDTEELLNNARHYADAPVDIFEWRADFFSQQTTTAYLSAGAALQAMTEKPVLWTLRTDREGGNFAGTDAEYTDLIQFIAQCGLFDAMDIELERTDAASAVELAHETNTTVIMSYHNFNETPSLEVILSLFTRMAEAGADVLKIALMPQKPEDVLTLMQATIQARRTFDVPVLSISMGQAGQASRVLGTLYGSCATFASLQKASAPGQIQAQTLTEQLAFFSV